MPNRDTCLNFKTEVTLAAQPKIESVVLYSHRVSRCKLKGTAASFVLKECNNPVRARLELLAQEFFRLIIPHQPETCLAVDKSTDVHYILSQEVSGYVLLPQGQAESFKENGHFTGLGQVCLVSRFLQEEDLKNGNLGLNDKNQVIKIDGDKCFFELRVKTSHTKVNYKISPRSINQLPYPFDFQPFNWLDIVKQGIAKSSSTIISSDLSESPKFRAEINQAMLRICLLPNGFLEEFVDACMPAGGQRFLSFLVTHRDELRASALTNTSFVNYINSPVAAAEAEHFIAHLKTFKVNRTELVSKSAQLENRVNVQMQLIQWHIAQAKQLIAQSHQTITELRKLDVPGKNVDLDNYLAISFQKLASSGHEPAQLIDIKEELAKKLLLAKEPKNIQQYSELMAVTNELVKKIRVGTPFGQNIDLDAYIEKIKTAWLEPEVLKKINTILLGVPKALELIKSNYFLIDEISKYTKDESTITHLLYEIKNCGYDSDALEALRKHIMGVLATTLKKEIESYIVDDSNKGLISYVAKMSEEIAQFDADPAKLELLNKSLREKLFLLLKNECALLLQELQKHAKISPKLIADLKASDLNQLPILKKELMKQQSIIANMMEVLRYIKMIRSNVSLVADPALHNYLKAAEAMLNKGALDQLWLKKTLLELKGKYESIQQAENLQRENRNLFAKINLLLDSKRKSDFANILLKIEGCRYDPKLLSVLKTELEGVLAQETAVLINECNDLLKQLEAYDVDSNLIKVLADKLSVCSQESEKLLALKVEIETTVHIACLRGEILGGLNILSSHKFGNNDLLLTQYIQKRHELTQNNQNLKDLIKIEAELSAALASSQPADDIKVYIMDLRKRGQPYEAMANQLEKTLAIMIFEKRGMFIKAQLANIQNNKINIPVVNSTLRMKERLTQIQNANAVPAQAPMMAHGNILATGTKL